MSAASDDFTTPAYTKRLVELLKQAMTEQELKAINSEDLAAVKPRKFTDILGQSDTSEPNYWWRLYINPMDWAKAQHWWESEWFKKDPREKTLDKNHKHPGYLYNYDDVETTKPKNFHDPMVQGYIKYLVHDILHEFVGPHSLKPLTYDHYVSIWSDAKPEEKDSEGAHFRQKTGKEGIFTGSLILAEDIYHEPKFNIGGHEWALASLMTEKTIGDIDKPNPKNPAFLYHVDEWKEQFPGAGPEQLKPGIDEVFKRFHTDISHAKSRLNQLKAIARCVRSLHVMHAFSDGCGRCNVFTILPLLLLEYGFGLPLGGKNGQNIPKDAIHLMFNGGYSLDDMAHFLWVTQDFGLQAEGHHSSIYPADGKGK